MTINTNTESITITIRLFAIFRDFFSGQSEVDLQLPVNSTLTIVRKALVEKMASMTEQKRRQGDPEGMVHSAAFALSSKRSNEMEILTDNEFIFNETCSLDVLPPVCGG